MTPPELIALTQERTAVLIQHAGAELDDDSVREPSRVPGWSRGHLLTHLARNADALDNLFTWASTGVETPMYESREARSAAIDHGSGRPVHDLLHDLAESSVRWSAAGKALPEEAWSTRIRYGAHDVTGLASWIPVMRLTEIELHHLDLDIGADTSGWTSAWVGPALADACTDLGERAGEPVRLEASDTGTTYADSTGRTITGSAAELLLWVTGRSDGSALESAEPLPELGHWR